MRYTLILYVLVIMMACETAPTHEDILLMQQVASEQRQRNDELVRSIRTRLEYFGAPEDEALYYENSQSISTMREALLEGLQANKLLAYNDSLTQRYEFIFTSTNENILWSDQDEALNSFYKTKLSEQNDLLTYYKLLYTTMKKEYALHALNARLMAD